MRIRAELEQNGKTAVGFAVPEDVVLSLAKSDETRQRRIEKSVAALRVGKPR